MPVSLKFHNTLSRTKDVLRPIDPANVRMYVCGPTVYDYAHIGNARPAIVFDQLFRLLRHVYGAPHVIYARNITDVDDKINDRARRDYPDRPLNEAIALVTAAPERQYQADVAALGCLAPTHEPHATAHIADMRQMIERLVARGVAYVAEDHVLFSPSAMDAQSLWPKYGSLARRPLDEMLAGARIDVAAYKRDTMDFVLWKPSTGAQPGWESPCAIARVGRPGWHLECSAMAMRTLLSPFGGGLKCDDPDRNVFDIHGGGIDLVFPHHENEVAQSCCALGAPRMANLWMHNGFLQLEGEKMSKSLNNFITMHQLLRTEEFGGRAWSGAALRLAMLRTHYRQPIDWTVRSVEESDRAIKRFADVAAPAGAPAEHPSDALLEALADDLNTPAAIAHLHGLAQDGDSAQLWRDAAFLGLDLAAATAAPAIDGALRSRVEALIERRLAARRARDWATADNLRGELESLGVALKDSKDGTSWELRR